MEKSNVNDLPPIFLLPTHMALEELSQMEKSLEKHEVRLTHNASKAGIFLGKVQQKRRALFELRSRNIQTHEVMDVAEPLEDSAPPNKKQRLDSSTIGEEFQASPIVSEEISRKMNTECSVSAGSNELISPNHSLITNSSNNANEPIAVKVVNISWIRDSGAAKLLLPLDKYIVYEGFKSIIRPTTLEGLVDSTSKSESRIAQSNRSAAPISGVTQSSIIAESILSRAEQESISQRPRKSRGRLLDQRSADVRFRHKAFASTSQTSKTKPGNHRPPLLREDTGEFEDGLDLHIPSMPEWVKSNSRYSCERATPVDNPNHKFLEELKKIRVARLLIGDRIGVRAYSTSIAAIAAYPYLISSHHEIIALPGCDAKIASLWKEWKDNDGHIKASDESQNDETMKTLRLFYDIWGVGDKTAREFYFERGWRDLDDIVEYGWNTLTRVQQIGVKFFDEFLETIPRSEVQFIADKIREHAIRVRGEGVETCIVGGFRRGKEYSGDVDVIVSHRDSSMSLGIVKDIVASLEEEHWITHTLLLSLNTSKRDQATLPYRMDGGGHGFDSLDKALVVWQNPYWEGKVVGDTDAKNPNIHRRVDIIISPWRTVGCAVMGWSGGTTFQRDLRRYAKYVKGWKFDSSGVRDRATGKVVDLEGDPDTKISPEEAEKRVFRGLGLQYQEPWERCTG